MDNYLKLFDLIGVFARRRYRAAEQNFSTLGLNHTEARLLTLLDQEAGTATQEVLSNMLFVDRGLRIADWMKVDPLFPALFQMYRSRSC